MVISNQLLFKEMRGLHDFILLKRNPVRYSKEYALVLQKQKSCRLQYRINCLLSPVSIHLQINEAHKIIKQSL